MSSVLLLPIGVPVPQHANVLTTGSECFVPLKVTPDMVGPASESCYKDYIKEGWCGHWKGIENVPHAQKYFQHISREDCYARCDANTLCNQAVFESAGPWGTQCWLGQNVMDILHHHPGASRNSGQEIQCIDECFSKIGWLAEMPANKPPCPPPPGAPCASPSLPPLAPPKAPPAAPPSKPPNAPPSSPPSVPPSKPPNAPPSVPPSKPPSPPPKPPPSPPPLPPLVTPVGPSKFVDAVSPGAILSQLATQTFSRQGDLTIQTSPDPSWKNTSAPLIGGLAKLQIGATHSLPGWCVHWSQGSSAGKPDSYPGISRDECFGHCDSDAACHQAVYESDGPWGAQCWLGVNRMHTVTQRPRRSRPCVRKQCVDECYNKHGWYAAEDMKSIDAQFEATLDCSGASDADSCVGANGADGIATFGTSAVMPVTLLGVDMSVDLNYTAIAFSDPAEGGRHTFGFMTFKPMQEISLGQILTGVADDSALPGAIKNGISKVTSWVPTLKNYRITVAAGASTALASSDRTYQSASMSAYAKSCTGCSHKETLGRTEVTVAQWAASTGVRRFPAFADVMHDGMYVRGDVTVGEATPFGFMLCFIPRLTADDPDSACAARLATNLELYVPLANTISLAGNEVKMPIGYQRLAHTHVQASFGTYGPRSNALIRSMGKQTIRYTGFVPPNLLTQAQYTLEMNIDHIEFALPTKLERRGLLFVPADYSFRFAVSAKAVFEHSYEQLCGAREQVQMGVIIPPRAGGMRIPFPGDRAVHLSAGGSISFMSTICAATFFLGPQLSVLLFGQFEVASQQYEVGVQLPPFSPFNIVTGIANPVGPLATTGVYISKSGATLMHVMQSFLTMTGMPDVEIPPVFGAFSVPHFRLCFAPTSPLEFFNPTGPSIHCPQGLQTDVTFQILGSTVSGSLSAIINREGVRTFGDLDASLELQNPHLLASKLSSAMRTVLTAAIPGDNRIIKAVFDRAVDKVLSHVEVNKAKVALGLSLGLPVQPPRFLVELIGRVGSRNIDFSLGPIPSLDTTKSVAQQIGSLLRSLSVRDLAAKIGLNVGGAQICTPQHCTQRHCTQRHCYRTPEVCAGRGRWRKCAGGNERCTPEVCTPAVCTPPVKFCRNNPFHAATSLSTVTAADAHAWAHHVELLFNESSSADLAESFPAFTSLLAHNADDAAPPLTELELVQALYGVLSLGSRGDSDRAAADAEFHATVHEMGTVVNLLGVAEPEQVLTRAAWAAKKAEVLAHVKQFVVRKATAHALKVSKM